MFIIELSGNRRVARDVRRKKTVSEYGEVGHN